MGRSPKPQYVSILELSREIVRVVEILLVASELSTERVLTMRDRLNELLKDLEDEVASEWCERP